MPTSPSTPNLSARRPSWPVWTLIVILIGAAVSFGQRSRRSRGEPVRPVPEWSVDPAFEHDVFSFARLRYESWDQGWGSFGSRRGRGRWSVDAPEADLNLSYRLQQMTSLKVNPEVTYIDITPEELRHYPFVYMVEPGSLYFTDDQVIALREYLLNGGFLMVDDFWGDEDWRNFRNEIERVFPDHPLVELEVDHPIFHAVFDLDEKPQMPGIGNYFQTGETSERGAGPVHYWAIFDDKGRMMTIICHNTDLGDGWEQEGADPTYFHQFSEKMAYPMAINIIYYAMTH